MLGAKTGAFPTADMDKVIITEPVDCPVRKEVLEALLVLLHDRNQASMESRVAKLSDEAVLDLVAALELYQAQEVLDVCARWIRNSTALRPWLAFRYALQHRDISTLDCAARYTLASNISAAHEVNKLDHLTARAWYKYRDPFIFVIDTFLAVPPPEINSKQKPHWCGGWDTYEELVKKELGECTVDSLLKQIAIARRGASTFLSEKLWRKALEIVSYSARSKGHPCGLCGTRANKWEAMVRAKIHALQPQVKFSDILRELDPSAYDSS